MWRLEGKVDEHISFNETSVHSRKDPPQAQNAGWGRNGPSGSWSWAQRLSGFIAKAQCGIPDLTPDSAPEQTNGPR